MLTAGVVLGPGAARDAPRQVKPATAQSSPVETVASRFSGTAGASEDAESRSTTAGSMVPSHFEPVGTDSADPGQLLGLGEGVEEVSTLHAGSVTAGGTASRMVCGARAPGRRGGTRGRWSPPAGDGLRPPVHEQPAERGAEVDGAAGVRDDGQLPGRHPVEGQCQPAVAGGVGQLEHREVAWHDVTVHELGGAPHPREPLDALSDESHPAQPGARGEVVAGAQRGPRGLDLPQRFGSATVNRGSTGNACPRGPSAGPWRRRRRRLAWRRSP